MIEPSAFGRHEMNESFEQFVRDHQNMVFSAARRILGNDADAQDVAQEAFIKAFGRFEELRLSPTAGGWLRKVATNLALNHVTRYRARWVFIGEGVYPGEDGYSGVAEPASPLPDTSALEEDERREILNLALNHLPDAQRIPLVLFHFEEMSYEEIASALRISLSKVKTDIFRAREALRRRLALAIERNAARTGGALSKASPRPKGGRDSHPPSQALFDPGWFELLEGVGCAMAK